MKKTILGLILIASLVSCSNENKMKSEIEAYLEKNAKDPKSYEFVELKIVDTVTSGEVAKHKIDKLTFENSDFKLEIAINESKILRHKLDKYASSYKEIDSLMLGTINNYKSFINANVADSLKLVKKLNDKTIVGYYTQHSYRLKNGFGALDLDNSYVAFDTDFKLLKFDKALDYSVFKTK